MTRYIVTRANFLVFGVLVAILLLVGGMTWDHFIAARTAGEWSEHSYQVLGAIKDLNLAIRHAETGQRERRRTKTSPSGAVGLAAIAHHGRRRPVIC
jgi:CHASE3 domain sensor protein